MNMDIIKNVENPLVSRKEIIAEIAFSGKTPSNDEVKAALSKSTGKDVTLIKIKKIDTIFGKQSAKVTAYVYSSIEAMDKIEYKPKVKAAPAN